MSVIRTLHLLIRLLSFNICYINNQTTWLQRRAITHTSRKPFHAMWHVLFLIHKDSLSTQSTDWDVNTPLSPAEKHSSAYSNNIRFHWENYMVQWCSKHMSGTRKWRLKLSKQACSGSAEAKTKIPLSGKRVCAFCSWKGFRCGEKQVITTTFTPTEWGCARQCFDRSLWSLRIRAKTGVGWMERRRKEQKQR